MMMKNTNELIVEQIVVVLVLIVHLCGFMNISSHDTSRQDFRRDLFHHYNKNYQNLIFENPKKSRVILMIIDALRMDHLVASDQPLMKYSRDILQKRQGLGYSLKTATPTVTLPRIKSMITGSLSSFIDIIFNFASEKLREENIVLFWKKKGLILHLHGDDTWLRLFPTEFDQQNGVTSFFVTDYTEVDNNITRYLTKDYLSSSWDILILHYLGLDHIGHLEGPQSSLIPPKLEEMDNVINRIHQHLKKEQRNYVFVVCGDHGMSDAGGHGGASHNEIWTSAFFMSHLLDNEGPSTFSKEELHNQVDITSTLAAFTGTDIPSGNIGRFFVKLIRKMSIKEQLFAHYRLAQQLMWRANHSASLLEIDKLRLLFSEVSRHHQDLNRLWTSQNKPNVNKVLTLYEKFEMLASLSLLDTVQSYDLVLLVISTSLLTSITLLSICSSIFLSKRNLALALDMKKVVSILLVLVLCFFISWSALMVLPPFLYVMFQLQNFYHSSISREPNKAFRYFTQTAIVLGSLFLPLTLLSTSMVEEEHLTYYFTLSTLYFILFSSLLFSFIRRVIGCDALFSYSTFDSKESSDSMNQDSQWSFPALYNLNIRIGKYFKTAFKVLFIFKFRNSFKTNPLFMQYICTITLLFASSCLFRLCRSFNSTGDKWRHLPDVNDFLKNSEAFLFIPILICGILAIFLLYHAYNVVLVSLAVLAIVCRHYPLFGEGIQSGVVESQAAHLLICSLFLFGLLKITKESIFATEEARMDLRILFLRYLEAFLALVYVLLQKPENILVTALLLVHFHLLLPLLVKNRVLLGLSSWNISVLALWVAQAHFFMEGNSNSLSSVQVNAGFVGITSYRPIIHGTLIAVHTFGSRVLVLLHFLIIILCYERKLQCCENVLWTWWCFQLVTITVYTINVTAQRYHLFIWSVFAPKLLYEECNLLSLVILTLVFKLSNIIFGKASTSE